MSSSSTDYVIHETFESGMDNWWVEGCEDAWVEDGRLYMKSDSPEQTGGTIFCKTPHPADFVLEYDAHVVSSSLGVNNINMLFCYSHPGGKSLYETRDERSDGRYAKYHLLNGYINTFLCDDRGEGGYNPDGSPKARFRFRRNPGFELLNELFDFEHKQGVTYHLRLVKDGGDLSFFVDDRLWLEAHDPQPWGEGLMGLRTYHTLLWWTNIRLRAL